MNRRGGTEHFDFDGLVLNALRAGASDVHMQTGSRPFFRIDGDVMATDAAVVSNETIEAVKSLILDDTAARQMEETGSVDRSYTLHDDGLIVGRLRVSFGRCIEGYKIVGRLIPIEVPTIDGLQLPQVFNHIADQLSGLVIIGGVTGAGKSTTLAAMLERINTERKVHVVTIEDPVEFIHTPKQSIFTHREIGISVPSFAEGLRTVLRQDPDVILVGEMRDLDSIRYGLVAAETGHLVFTTVHSETVSDIPERIVSMFPEGEQGQARFQIADVGLAFIAQRLVKRRGKPGRLPAFEILVLNSAARNLIRSKKSHQLDSVMQTQARAGCTTMTHDLIEMHKAGLIGRETLIACAPNKERARKYAMEQVHVDTAEPAFIAPDFRPGP